jgi:hypothetical protein
VLIRPLGQWRLSPCVVGVAANGYTISIGFTVGVMEVRFSHVPIVPTSSHREIVQKTSDA